MQQHLVVLEHLWQTPVLLSLSHFVLSKETS